MEHRFYLGIDLDDQYAVISSYELNYLLYLSAHRRLEAGQGGASRSGGGMILHFPPAARIIKAV